jgi:zinc-binding alcohol dehydrogenase/oxidoreductase
LGCSGGFDYTSDNWVEKAIAETGGFDLILDSAMGDTLNNLIKVTKSGGRNRFLWSYKRKCNGI